MNQWLEIKNGVDSSRVLAHSTSSAFIHINANLVSKMSFRKSFGKGKHRK